MTDLMSPTDDQARYRSDLVTNLMSPTDDHTIGQPNEQIVEPTTKWSDHLVDSA